MCCKSSPRDALRNVGQQARAPVEKDPVLAAGPPAVPQFQARELAALRVGGEGGPSRPKTLRPLVLRALLFTQKVPSARDG